MLLVVGCSSVLQENRKERDNYTTRYSGKDELGAENIRDKRLLYLAHYIHSRKKVS